MMLMRRKASRQWGFSLIELLLAIFILGVGIISIAAVFPAGIILQRKAQDDVLGPAVAESALALIRSRLSQDDFGTFEEFGFPSAIPFVDPNGPNGWLQGEQPWNRWLDRQDAYTVRGDWPWMRPAMAAVPVGFEFVPENVQPPEVPREWEDEGRIAGDVDIFGARMGRKYLSGTLPFAAYPGEAGDELELVWPNDWSTAEFARAGQRPAIPDFSDPETAAIFQDDPEAFLFGIPFNRKKYSYIALDPERTDPELDSKIDPLVTIRQEERFWPGGTGYFEGQDQPQYVWDCMFRKFQGQVQVAIFVYRLNGAGKSEPYAVSQDDGPPSTVDSDFDRDAWRPPMPMRLDLRFGEDVEPLDPFGADQNEELGESINNTDAERNVIPGTEANFSGALEDSFLEPRFETWQNAGQWLLDPYGRVHRILQGRNTKREGPVRLTRPIPEQAPSTVFSNIGQSPEALQDDVNRVRSLWYVPSEDRRGYSLTPVYVTVRTL